MIKPRKNVRTSNGLSPPVPCSPCGLTNPPDYCIKESECIYNGLVPQQIYMLQIWKKNIDQSFLSSEAYRYTCTHTYFLTPMSSGDPKTSSTEISNFFYYRTSPIRKKKQFKPVYVNKYQTTVPVSEGWGLKYVLYSPRGKCSMVILILCMTISKCIKIVRANFHKKK